MSNKFALTPAPAVAEEVEFLALYDRACREIDAILQLIPEEQRGSLEALNSTFVGRLLVAIADTFTGLLLTFKTNLTKFFRTLKRSELREFVESNKAKTFVVQRLPYAKVYQCDIDCPAQMDGTYKQAIASVENIYIKLNALPIAKTTLTSMQTILRGITGASKNVGDTINTTANVITRICDQAKPAVIECQKKFTGKFEAKVKFEKVFTSMRELEECKDDLLRLEPRLQDVHALTELVKQLEDVLKGIVSALELNKDVALSAREINNLGETAKGTALIFDSYGLAGLRQVALEHNLVLCINTIYSKCK